MRRVIGLMRRSDTGAAAVEFALVWVVFALLLLGIIQFGTILSQWLQLSHAAREGARWAALRNPVSAVQTRAQNAAPFAAGATVSVSADPPSSSPGDPITVTVVRTVDSPLSGVVGSGYNMPGGGISLRATATQRAE